MMTLNNAMRLSATGMSAERFRMDVISSNIANANSMKVGDREPYRRRMVVLEGGVDGVRINRVREDQSQLRQVQEPGNPFADENGYVTYSNIDPLTEMVDMMSATRAYEANIAAFNSAKGMVRAALSIGRV
jgi:flagellar basal-body rod protein FlgC